MNYPEVIEYSYNGDKFRAEYTFDEFYDVYIWNENESVGPFVKDKEVDLGWWIMYYHHSYEGIMEMINEQKEKLMSNINKAKQVVESAQKQLEEAVKALEQAEKKASKIGLKLPEMGEKYYSEYYSGRFTREDCDNNPYFSSFASTNKAQQRAFQEALVVMAEMRMQDGIVVPDGEHKVYPIYLDVGENTLNVDCWETDTGTSLFPAFESQGAAQKAINGVGEGRIINCIKTMMFMTPESRGEIE